MTSRPTLWWVKDSLSGECIDDTYYSEKQEAVDRRNEMGFGVVMAWIIINEKGDHYEESAGRGKLRIFNDPVD